MLTLHSYTLGPLQTNTYLIALQNHQALIIDPAADGDFLSDELTLLHLKLKLIFFTHGHFDHVCGALPLFLNFQPLVFLNAPDLPLYRRARETALHFTHQPADPLIPPKYLLTKPAALAAQLAQLFPHTPIQILPFPGHSPGLTALYFPKRHQLFSGDLIFPGGALGRTDFPYSNPHAMQTSLQKVLTLPPATQVYPGHEAAFPLTQFSALTV